MPRFIQIHTLISYPSSLLNRDDVGFAKRIEFGGAVRTRISSQCLKRHWRTFEGAHSLRETGQPMSVRSRVTFEQLIVEPLIAEGLPEARVRPVVDALQGLVLKGEAGAVKEEPAEKKAPRAKKGKAEKTTEAAEEAPATEAAEAKPAKQTEQVTVLGAKEVDYLRKVARELCQQLPEGSKPGDLLNKKTSKELKDNLRALGAGLDAAMFGRMVTSDVVLTRMDAALHVAHAMTVHREFAETDYFSAVDELTRGEGALGSGHINTSELTSGLFYGYVVIDVPLLVSNLMGVARAEWNKADRALAADVVSRMVHLVATVTPGAKLGATAPHSYASLVLVESGNAQPRTLANAFLSPVRTTRESADLLANTYGALAEHVRDLDEMYGHDGQRALAAAGPVSALGGLATSKRPLGDVAKFAANAVVEA